MPKFTSEEVKRAAEKLSDHWWADDYVEMLEAFAELLEVVTEECNCCRNSMNPMDSVDAILEIRKAAGLG